jgi:D-inositol-3-phosphate glycosyltransferase
MISVSQNRSIGIVCTSPGFGGLEMNTLKLAENLREQGWKVRLLVSNKSRMAEKATGYADDVCVVQDFKKSGKGRSSLSVLKHWLVEEPVDILFTPYNKDIPAISSYKRFRDRKVKFVYQQHMKIGVNKRDPIHTFRYNMIDLWISPLEYLRRETLKRTRVTEGKIVVIPFGLETSIFESSSITRAEARRQLDLPADGFIIGVLGRIDPKKGQDFLVRALQNLRQHGQTDVHLLIMGDVTAHEGDGFRDRVIGLIDKSGMTSFVHLRSFNPEVMLFYKAIDVFAMSSHGETFGMVTIEAMAVGIPVIGVGRDGTKEIIGNAESGYLHELEDIEGFIKSVYTIREGGDALAAVLAHAKEEVRLKYTAEKANADINRTLTNLLDKS